MNRAFEAGARGAAPQSGLESECVKPAIQRGVVFGADVLRTIVRAVLQHRVAEYMLAGHLRHAVDGSER